MVEKRQLRKRDRVSRLFERDGRATSLAEGFPLLHIKHILQLLHSAVRHISKILSGCLLPAILFPPSTPSRGTTATRSELQEGALGTLSEKNGIMWEKFPNGGGGSDPNPLLDVYLIYLKL